jgi:hypothetical protein
MTGKCAACRSTFDLADLLLVVDRESGATIYVCRPQSEGRCFRSAVGPAYLETIALAVPEPPPLPRPVSERPPTPWGRAHDAKPTQSTAAALQS